MGTMMTYEDTMAWGARQYDDVLTALDEAGLPAKFTQTGGMCAAIEVQLESGWTLLVTDSEDSLAWVREEHLGWSVGLYNAKEDGDGPHAFGQVDRSDVPALLTLAADVLLRRNNTAC